MVYKDLESVTTKFRAWAERMPEKAREALTKAGYLVRNEAVSRHLSGPAMSRGVGSATDGTLQPRSGYLRRSIRVRLGGGEDVACYVGTDAVYAAIHEYGGPIRGGQMPQRAYLNPSLDAKRAAIVDLLEEAMAGGYDG